MPQRARLADSPAVPAKPPVVSLAADSGSIAGSFVYEGERLDTGWHTHLHCELQYSALGVIEIETVIGEYLLPPQQAAWLPAGMPHRTVIPAGTRNIAVILGNEIVSGRHTEFRILGVSRLLREMALHATRWPVTSQDGQSDAAHFFYTLARLVDDELDLPTPLRLPTSTDPLVAAAMAFTQARLPRVTIADVATAVNASERTLRRKFDEELGLSWRKYLTQSRILRAMAHLSDARLTVLAVAQRVGFENPSAFSRAFFEHCHEAPTEYRRRILSDTV